MCRVFVCFTQEQDDYRKKQLHETIKLLFIIIIIINNTSHWGCGRNHCQALGQFSVIFFLLVSDLQLQNEILAFYSQYFPQI